MTVSKLYTLPEVANLLGVHRTTIMRDCDRREITTVKIGRRRLVSEDALSEYLQRRTIPAETTAA